MDRAEAIQICEEWFAYLDRQREKAKVLAEAASLARQGNTREARRLKNSVDRGLTVYDGARLEPAVKFLIQEKAE